MPLPESTTLPPGLVRVDLPWKGFSWQLVPLPVSDFPSESAELDKISQNELEDIILNKRIDGQALGTARSLEEYEDYASIDFALKKIS